MEKPEKLWRILGIVGALGAGAVAFERCTDGPDFVEVTKEDGLLRFSHSEIRVKESVDITLSPDDGSTVYAVLLKILEKNEEYQALHKAEQQACIDAIIGVTRKMNPKKNLDNFGDIVGKPLRFPAEFSWRSRRQEVLSAKEEGYAALQSIAESDGFPLRTGNKNKIYQEAYRHATTLPLSGVGYALDRVGSEDSPNKLEKDVVESIQRTGEAFAKKTNGWSFVVTDMMRNEGAQKNRKNGAESSTHLTGRSFDISDGRWKTPDGKVITWSIPDASGKMSRGPHAQNIDDVLRPAFESLAIAHDSWILFKESGHWHVYYPKTHHVDLKESWKAFFSSKTSPAASSEKVFEGFASGEIKGNVASFLLRDAERIERERIAPEEAKQQRDDLERDLQQAFEKYLGRTVKRPFLTAISEFPSEGSTPEEREKAALKLRVLTLLRKAPLESLGDLGILTGTTVHSDNRPPFSDLEGIWKWKDEKRSSSKNNAYIKAIVQGVARVNHTVGISEWLGIQQHLQDAVVKHRKHFSVHEDLIRYTSPEIVLATVHAEFFSELDGPTYVALLPVLFKGYNLVFAPSANDNELSAGLAQVIFPTLLTGPASMGERFRVGTEAIATERGLKSIKIPEEQGRGFVPSEVANTMVLDAVSASYWAYLSLLYHMGPGFEILMNDKDFLRAWTSASEAEKMIFLGTYAPLANNGGIGRAKSVARDIVSGMKSGESLSEVTTFVISHRLTTPTAQRGAKVGHESIQALFGAAGE